MHSFLRQSNLQQVSKLITYIDLHLLLLEGNLFLMRLQLLLQLLVFLLQLELLLHLMLQLLLQSQLSLPMEGGLLKRSERTQLYNIDTNYMVHMSVNTLQGKAL